MRRLLFSVLVLAVVLVLVLTSPARAQPPGGGDDDGYDDRVTVQWTALDAWGDGWDASLWLQFRAVGASRDWVNVTEAVGHMGLSAHKELINTTLSVGGEYQVEFVGTGWREEVGAALCGRNISWYVEDDAAATILVGAGGACEWLCTEGTWVSMKVGTDQPLPRYWGHGMELRGTAERQRLRRLHFTWLTRDQTMCVAHNTSSHCVTAASDPAPSFYCDFNVSFCAGGPGPAVMLNCSRSGKESVCFNDAGTCERAYQTTAVSHDTFNDAWNGNAIIFRRVAPLPAGDTTRISSNHSGDSETYPLWLPAGNFTMDADVSIYKWYYEAGWEICGRTGSLTEISGILEINPALPDNCKWHCPGGVFVPIGINGAVWVGEQYSAGALVLDGQSPHPNAHWLLINRLLVTGQHLCFTVKDDAPVCTSLHMAACSRDVWIGDPANLFPCNDHGQAGRHAVCVFADGLVEFHEPRCSNETIFDSGPDFDGWKGGALQFSSTLATSRGNTRFIVPYSLAYGFVTLDTSVCLQDYMNHSVAYVPAFGNDEFAVRWRTPDCEFREGSSATKGLMVRGQPPGNCSWYCAPGSHWYPFDLESAENHKLELTTDGSNLTVVLTSEANTQMECLAADTCYLAEPARPGLCSNGDVRMCPGTYSCSSELLCIAAPPGADDDAGVANCTFGSPAPSTSPSLFPSLSPTLSPQPTLHPTPHPTNSPTFFPSPSPTTMPTQNPTDVPTFSPTFDQATGQVGSAAGAEYDTLDEALEDCARHPISGCVLELLPGETHTLRTPIQIQKKAHFILRSAWSAQYTHASVRVQLSNSNSSSPPIVAPLLIADTASVVISNISWTVDTTSMQGVPSTSSSFGASDQPQGNGAGAWDNSTTSIRAHPAVILSVLNATDVAISNVSFSDMALGGTLTQYGDGALPWTAGLLLNDTAIVSIWRTNGSVAMRNVQLRAIRLAGRSSAVAIRHVSGNVRLLDWRVVDMTLEHGHCVAVADASSSGSTAADAVRFESSFLSNVNVSGVGSPVYLAGASSSAGLYVRQNRFLSVAGCGAHAVAFRGDGFLQWNELTEVDRPGIDGSLCAVAQPSGTHPSASVVQWRSDAALVVQGNNLSSSATAWDVMLAWSANTADGVLARNNEFQSGTFRLLGENTFALQCPGIQTVYYHGHLTCDDLATCTDFSGASAAGVGFTCLCESPFTGNPFQECEIPPGEINPVPNPVVLNPLVKPLSGNSSVSLINVGQSKVPFGLLTPDEFCHNVSTRLDTNDTNQLCGASATGGQVVTEVATELARGLILYNLSDHSVPERHTWRLEKEDGSDLTEQQTQACSFMLGVFTMSPRQLQQGSYFSYFVLDAAAANGGAKLLEVSFDVQAAVSPANSTYSLYAQSGSKLTDDTTFGAGEFVILQVLPYDMDNISIPIPTETFAATITPAGLTAADRWAAGNLSLGMADCSPVELQTLWADGLLPSDGNFTNRTGVPDTFPLSGVSYFKCPSSPLFLGSYNVSVRLASGDGGLVSSSWSLVRSECAAEFISAGSRCTCAAGQFLLNEECAVCASGSAKGLVGDDACERCGVNSQANENLTACVCDASKHYVASAEGVCACKAGYAYVGDGEACTPCDFGFYKQNDANVGCTACVLPDDMTTAFQGSTSNASCVCDRSLYFYRSNSGSVHCEDCPDGSECNSIGFTLQSLVMNEGFWRASLSSHKVLPCPVPKACIGSSSPNTSYGDSLCLTGHNGPYCAVCRNGYYSSYSGVCQECSAESLTNSYILFTVLLMIAAVFVYYIVRVTSTLAERAEGQSRGHRALSLFDHIEKSTLRIAERSIRSVSRRRSAAKGEDKNGDDELSQSEHSRSARASATDRRSGTGPGSRDEDDSQQMRARGLIVKLKIAFVFFQVVLLFQDTYLVAFPADYLRFLDLFSFIQFDWFRVAQMECTVEGGFGSKLLLSTLLPLGVFMMLLVAWMGAFSKYKDRNKPAMIVVENTLINLFLVITYVLFPSLATTIFSTFVCETFDDGETLLRADYNVDCKSAYYQRLVLFASFMIVVYPIGIPALYAWMLFRVRDEVNPQRVDPNMPISRVIYLREAKVNYLKFLYDAFKPKYYWMEVFECGRKLALTGFVVFLFEGSALQIYCGILVSVFSVMLYCYTRPFLFQSNNYFSVFAHTQITITLIGVSMLRYNQAANASDDSEQDSNYTDFDVAVLLICSNVSVLVIGMGLVLYSCFNTSERDFLDAGYVSDGRGGYRLENNDEVFAEAQRARINANVGASDNFWTKAPGSVVLDESGGGGGGSRPFVVGVAAPTAAALYSSHISGLGRRSQANDEESKNRLEQELVSPMSGRGQLSGVRNPVVPAAALVVHKDEDGEQVVDLTGGGGVVQMPNVPVQPPVSVRVVAQPSQRRSSQPMVGMRARSAATAAGSAGSAAQRQTTQGRTAQGGAVPMQQSASKLGIARGTVQERKAYYSTFVQRESLKQPSSRTAGRRRSSTGDDGAGKNQRKASGERGSNSVGSEDG